MPTPAHLSALKWLRNRGGDGVFADKSHQVLLARGERAAVMRRTWNALENDGLVERHESRRLRVTKLGWAADITRVDESECTEQ